MEIVFISTYSPSNNNRILSSQPSPEYISATHTYLVVQKCPRGNENIISFILKYLNWNAIQITVYHGTDECSFVYSFCFPALIVECVYTPYAGGSGTAGQALCRPVISSSHCVIGWAARRPSSIARSEAQAAGGSATAGSARAAARTAALVLWHAWRTLLATIVST